MIDVLIQSYALVMKERVNALSSSRNAALEHKPDTNGRFRMRQTFLLKPLCCRCIVSPVMDSNSSQTQEDPDSYSLLVLLSNKAAIV